MVPIYLDSKLNATEIRNRIYNGALFVFSPSDATLELCDLAKQMLNDVFAPHEPETAQYHIEVDEYSKILAEVKPAFIHHPACKEIIPSILDTLGFEPDDTYFDVPRLRTSTAQDYLTSGMAYAFKPHRDTWYSTPMCQINWWLPVYDLAEENTDITTELLR